MAGIKTLEDFTARVEKKESGCWEWTKGKYEFGYGRQRWKGKQWPTHRLVLRLMGVEIPKGMFVCHKCDNPPCCNPDHLFFGTTQDNTADKVAKGRQAKRERSNGVKLSSEDVEEIRRVYYAGLATQEDLGIRFGVSQVRIGMIVRNEAWESCQLGKLNFRSRSSKLTQEIADSIRVEYSLGVSNQRQLADKHGVHKTLISLIITNKIWRTKDA